MAPNNRTVAVYYRVPKDSTRRVGSRMGEVLSQRRAREEV